MTNEVWSYQYRLLSGNANSDWLAAHYKDVYDSSEKAVDGAAQLIDYMAVRGCQIETKTVQLP